MVKTLLSLEVSRARVLEILERAQARNDKKERITE